MMYFPAIVAAATAALLITAPGLLAAPSGNFIDKRYDGILSRYNIAGNSSVPVNQTLACLDSYRTNNWDGTLCGHYGWFKGRGWYRYPEDCYDACHDCLGQGIINGSSNMRCENKVGGATCWIGYAPESP